MAEHEVKGPGLDPVTERWVRDLLRGRDGDLSLRFHVAGGSVSMDVVSGGTTRRATGSSPRTAAFDVWLGGVLKARRMSQEAAARAVGVSLKTVNRWVNGRTEPRMRELRRIQEAFGVAPPL
jgi:DNA-binding XRE family transcriptional regulator